MTHNSKPSAEPVSPASDSARRLAQVAWYVSLLLLAYVLVVNAWMVDDAYITLRTVDNFVHGYGLTWNVAERVQVYTHPLWMLLLSLAYGITSESFFTVIAVSFVIAVAAVVVSRRLIVQNAPTDWWRAPLLVIALISSKAVIDYASSGLENPLSYLLAAVFLLQLRSLFTGKTALAPARIRALFFITALGYMNRPDTLLLFLPALVYVLWSSRPLPKCTVIGAVLVGLLPAIVWELFALFYYGFPFPNTVYAKVFATDFPYIWKLERGFAYLTNSLQWDTASYAILIAAFVFAIRKRSTEAQLALTGTLLYVLYTVVSAASATHMSGRFFAVPLFISIIVFVRLIPTRQVGLIAGGVLIAFIAISPLSAVKFGTSAYHASVQPPSSIDAKWYVADEGAALINWRPGRSLPDHSWYHYGEELRAKGPAVHVGGAFGGEAIGYVGFAAGPQVRIIDRVGLGDPLLARLPATRPSSSDDWKSGHFHRQIPDGYFESVARDTNLIVDPQIREYYDVIRTITRGPLFSGRRLLEIAKMNLSIYGHITH